MAYCTLAQVKTYLDITESGDDDLISDLISRAQARIDKFTGRTFEAASDTTRTLDSVEDVDGALLILGADLAAITTVTNGNGVVVAAGEYVTEPRNTVPFWGIRLKSSAGKSWQEDSDGDPENAISVVGKWAYSVTANADIIHACIRLAGYYYRQRDAQVFDTTATPELGIITVPQGFPSDVKRILTPYQKLG